MVKFSGVTISTILRVKRRKTCLSSLPRTIPQPISTKTNTVGPPIRKIDCWLILGNGFVDIAYLMGVSLEVDGKAGVSEDFNLDGKPDLIVLDSDLVEEQIHVKILEMI